MERSEARHRFAIVSRGLGRAAALAALMALGSAPALPQGLPPTGLPPLPLPPGLPLAPGPSSPGTAPQSPSPRLAPPPARPSRSPPSRCSGTSAPGPVPFAGSVFPCDFADPMVLKAGHVWFAYATAAGWEHGNRAFPILRSEDLRHWRAVGDALLRPPRWAGGDLWGPSVIAWRGSYLLYYNARRGRRGPHCLAVAVAREPQGPFRPARRIACQFRRQGGFIDPAPLVAPAARLYMFFSVDSPEHSIDAVRLSADGMHAAAHVSQMLQVSRRWRRLRSRTVEGPWPLRRRGRYYLFYSAGSWNSDYRMAYAVARRPQGPYSDTAPVAILRGRTQLTSPGGGSVISGGGGATWLAFHAWNGRPGYRFNSERTMRIAPLRWSRRGVPRVDLRGGG